MSTSDLSKVEPLWDARQVAQRLGIHRTNLYALVRTGLIPHLRIGRSVRFDPQAIRAWERAGGWASPKVKPHPRDTAFEQEGVAK